MKKILMIISILFCSLACEKQIEEQRIIKQSVSMGTFIEIQIISNDKQKADSVINLAFEEIERINKKYSTYKKDNYIYKLNSAADTFAVDTETYYLLKKCDEIYKKTDGRFDAAIGNLIKLITLRNDLRNLDLV